MGRRILIVALTAVCAAPVAAYEPLEPALVKSWSMSADADYQGGPDKVEALHKPLPTPLGEKQGIRDMQQQFDRAPSGTGLSTAPVPSGPGTGTFFLRNRNVPSAVGQPMTSPLAAVPPATAPARPSGPHPGTANFAFPDGSVRFNPVAKPGAVAGARR